MEDRFPTGPVRDATTPGAPLPARTLSSQAHPLPSGKFPLETHFAVVRRFMSVSRNGVEPVEPAAVEDQGVPPGAAVGNAPFLSDLGLLIEEKPGRFKPTALAMQLVNTQLADDQRGRRLLRSVINKTWFGVTAQAFLRAQQGRPFREDELMATLATAAPSGARQEEGAIHVLIEYLAYTGIAVLPVPDPSKTTSTTISTGAAASPAPPPVPASPASRLPRAGSGPQLRDSNKQEDWEVIETSEFSLRIRPKAAAVKRLRKQLDLLDQKLEESR